jgi:uncharacterized protein YhaN
MKIARLELRAYGKFKGDAGDELDFESDGAGLRIVYGPNEAGKSSALRALSDFLYGIPERSKAAFFHSYSNLRIGGVLTNGSGKRLECIRRKARTNDLRETDDVTPADPAALAAYLGGIDRELFETMFGIDHQALVAGGRAIAEGKGSLGQVLFAAGSGIANIKAIQAKLDSDAGRLFTPRGKEPRINAKLSEWEQVRRDTKAAQLSSADWEREDKLLRDSQAKLTETTEQLEQARIEHERFKRIEKAMAPAACRNDARAQLAPLADVRLLADDFAERWKNALRAREAAERAVRTAAESVAETDARIAEQVVPDDLLARGEAIEQLQNDLGGYRKARSDLPHLLANVEQLQAQAQGVLRHLRPDVPLADVEKLRLSNKQQLEIQNLGNEHKGLLERQRAARADLSKLEDQLRDADERLAALDAPRDAAALKSVLRRADGIGPLEETLAADREELARLEGQAAAALVRLAPWSGSLDEIETLPVPEPESIETFEAEFQRILQATQAVAKEIERAQADQADCHRQLEQARLSGDVPSETDLQAARRRRDEGWRLICRSWRDGQPVIAEEAQFIASAGQFIVSAGQSGDLAEAFAESVRLADDIADRLRREADRVAKHAALVARDDACRQSLEKLMAQRLTIENERQTAEREWQNLWQPLAIAPRSPREMRGWEHRYRDLTRQAETMRLRRTAIATHEQRLGLCRTALEGALAAIGEPGPAADESLPAVIERARDVAERIDVAINERVRLAKEAGQLGPRIDAARLAANDADRELTAWIERWSRVVELLGLPADATPAQANEVLSRLDGLFKQLEQRDSFQTRVEQIGRDSLVFERQVRDLASSLGKSGEFDRMAVDQAADRLLADYRRAVESRKVRDTLHGQRKKQSAQLAAARQAAAMAQSEMTTLVQEAGCDCEEALPLLVERSNEANRWRSKLKQAEDQLLLLSAGVPLAEFVEQIGRVDSDALPSKIAELGQRVAELDAEKTTLSNTVALASKALADVGSSGAAAEADGLARHVAAEIATDVEEYARLRLAAAVLREAMERYRARHQGPVLERASRLFAELTAGSFAGLRADYTDGDAAVLVGFRPGDDRAVPVEGMSEGTADQLYLALRLASLETWLSEHGPMPFIVDDILIKFDNERSIATLRVLADLARRTQVIFFTHHEHLLDLAREHLAADAFVVHYLAGGPKLQMTCAGSDE